MIALPALRYGDMTIPPARAINAAASQRAVAAAAERSVVPLVYGEDRIKALIVNVLPADASSSTLLVQCLWGFACDAVSEVLLNDKALPAGATVTHYTGAQVTPHAALVTAFAAQSITYADALTGYAYTVLAMPTSAFDGQLDVGAKVRGRKVYDVRKDSTAGGSGAHRLATPSTWEWSDNPALALADFCRDTTYGLARAVDWSTVHAAANACDAMVGSPAEKRRLIGVSFTQATAASDIADALRAYAGCFLLPGAAGLKLIADADAGAVASYSHADGTIAGIGDLQRRDIGNVPTAVEVAYTDTSAVPWREAAATASLAGAGSTRPWRLSQVKLPGIQRYSQAYREAQERLDKLSVADLSCTLEVFDLGIRHEEGDIVTVTHPLGLSALAMRIVGLEMPAAGRWRLRLVQHNASAYSTSTPSAPTLATPGLTSPVGPPANVQGLAGAAGDGIITWSWTGATERGYAETQLRLGGTDWDTAAPLWSGRGTAFVHQVAVAGSYTVRAKHVLTDGQASVAAASASATVTSVSGYVPDLTPPPTPTGLAATSLFRGILIEWTAPTYTVGHGNDFTEVYVATYGGSGPLPTIPGTPVGKAAGATSMFLHDAAMGAQLHVWIRFVSVDGVQGEAAGGTNGVQITVGTVGNSDLGPLIVEAGNLASGAVTAAKLAAQAVDLTKFASGIEPVSIVSAVPGALTTRSVFNTADGKLYRWNGSAYVATVPADDIAGQLQDAQVAALAASKITGQLSDSQLAAIAAAKVTGTLNASQLAVTIGGGNLVRNSSFEADTDSNGLADTWSGYSSGTTGAVAHSTVAGGRRGGKMQRISAANLGTSSNDRAGIYQDVSCAGTAGQKVILSAYLLTQGSYVPALYLYIDWLDGSSQYISGAEAIFVSAGNAPITALQRIIGSALTVPANAATARIYAWMQARTGGVSGLTEMWIDDVQLELGDVATAWAPRPDEILPGTITATEIADNAVTTPKLVAGAIVAGKIAANAISATEIQAGAVTTAKLAAAAVTTNELAAGSVVADKIASNAVTAAKIEAGAVEAAKIAAGAVVAGKIAANAVTANEIAANAVTADKVAANAITAGKIAAGAISADQIAANAIRTHHLLVAPQSVCPDPYFADEAWWEGTLKDPGGWVYQTPGVLDTAKQATLYLSGTARYHLWSAKIVCPPPTTKLRLRCRYTSTANQACYLVARFYSQAGATISDISLTLSNNAGANSDPSTIGTVPAGAATVAFILFNESGIAGSGAIGVSGVMLELAADASLIVDGAIVASKLAANSIAVGTAAIQNGAIVNAMIGNLAVDSAKIADGSIVTAKIGDAQITNAKVVSIDATKITAGYLDAARIAAGSITASQIDSRNLTIKDGSGNVIFGAGTALNYANIVASSSWLNSSITISGGAISGIGTGDGTAVANSQISLSSTGALVNAGGGQITQLDVNNLAAGVDFVPYLSWDWVDALLGWTSSGTSTFSAASGELTVESSGSDPVFVSPNTLSISGAKYDKIRARIKRTAGSGWEGAIYWAVSDNHSDGLGPSFSGSYYVTPVNVTNLPIGQWAIVEWDMKRLVSAENDWGSKTITQIRLDLGTTASDDFKVDWVAVGRHGPIFIDETNISTFIASAAIGSLDIATTGKLRSGKSAYGSGTGFLLEYNAGTPRLDIGSDSQYLRWSGSALLVKLNTVSLSATTPGGGSFSKSSSATPSLGSCTVTASGGTTPYSCSWTYTYEVDAAVSDVNNFGGASFSSNVANLYVANLYARGATDCIVSVTVTCVVTDANGLTATISRTAAGTFGSPS